MNKKVKLNENDRKNTLSAIKKSKQPKNVLVKSITDYWPVLNAEKCEKFLEIIQLFTSDADNKKHLSIGLESTLRILKNHENVNLLAIADEISPKWFGKHLILMALSKNPQMKIIIIPQMKDHTKKLFNVPSIIWSVRKEVESLDDFYKELNIHKGFLKEYYPGKLNKDEVTMKQNKEKAIKVEKVTPIVHLKKSSDSTPAFRPTINIEPEPMEFEDSANFISLAKFDVGSLVSKKSSVSAYRPIKVRKIIGNPDRKKK